MSAHLENQLRERDRLLRAKILSTLRLARLMSPGRLLSGETLRTCVDGAMGSADQFDGDDHALRLVRDLVGKGLVSEAKIKRNKPAPGLGGFTYELTDAGNSLSLMQDTAAGDEDED